MSHSQKNIIPCGLENSAPLDEPHTELQDFAHLGDYITRGWAPWRRSAGRRRVRLVNETLVSREQAGEAGANASPLHENYFVDERTFQRHLFKRFRPEISFNAISYLRRKRPLESAYQLLSRQQVMFIAGLLVLTASLIALWPRTVLIGVNILTTTYFISAIAFRMFLLFLSRWEKVGSPITKTLRSQDLPVITILLPLYDDAAALPALTRAIRDLDYPENKKDVKLLLEEDDPETIDEAARLELHTCFEIIVTPATGPRTKPKACNYGLQLARGDLIVIYDAEDLPEADQLKKAAAMFHGADDRLACVQARLNYYNADDNWLTRLFTLEYSLWFDWLLPALQRLGAPIPLGGTSNFFRTKTLRAIGGWDPYNVTEDADLGLRMARLGLGVKILDSTTFEEANCRTGNWVRQRSRWMKGYLQTWLVHMRQPGKLISNTGWIGFISVQLFVAGNLFSAIINPVMWGVSALWLLTSPPVAQTLFPAPLLQANLFALVFGNLFFISMMVCAPLKRGRASLSLYGLTAPAYWLLTSLAAYKAMWQAATRPHYWEKTDHTLSQAALEKRTEALNSGLFETTNKETNTTQCHISPDTPI